MTTTDVTPGPTTPERSASVPLVDLTDEELAALDGMPVGLVVSPYLEELPPAARDVAVVTAFRSLVARGLVVAPTAQQATAANRTAATAGAELAEVDVEMAEVLSQVLTLRRVADRVVCVQRTSGQARAWRYLHRVDDALTLDELVEPTGLHRYALVATPSLLDVLVDWVVPEGVDGPDGDEVALDASAAADGRAGDALVEQLAGAHVLADVTVRGRDDAAPGVLLGTFAGPAGLHLTTTAFGTGGRVRLRPVSRRTLRTALAEQLEGTR